MKHWLIGFAVGSLFAILVGMALVWIYRAETLNLVANLYGQRVVGKTKTLLRDGVLYQDGKEIGTLRRGARLLHRLQTESLEEFYLPIGWENKGRMDQLFSGAEKSERAFVIMEVRQQAK